MIMTTTTNRVAFSSRFFMGQNGVGHGTKLYAFLEFAFWSCFWTASPLFFSFIRVDSILASATYCYDSTKSRFDLYISVSRSAISVIGGCSIFQTLDGVGLLIPPKTSLWILCVCYIRTFFVNSWFAFLFTFLEMQSFIQCGTKLATRDPFIKCRGILPLSFHVNCSHWSQRSASRAHYALHGLYTSHTIWHYLFGCFLFFVSCCFCFF